MIEEQKQKESKGREIYPVEKMISSSWYVRNCDFSTQVTGMLYD